MNDRIKLVTSNLYGIKRTGITFKVIQVLLKIDVLEEQTFLLILLLLFVEAYYGKFSYRSLRRAV